MNSVWLTLPKSGEKLEVLVARKDMKNVRLKVFPDLKVALSTPKNVTDNWTEGYLNDKSSWIEERLALFKKTRGYEALGVIKNGTSTTILGRELLIIVEQSYVKKVYQQEDSIVVCVPDKTDQKGIMTLFDNWWRKQAKQYYENIIQKLYPIISKYNCDKPSLQIRKMKTLWGSASIDKDKITINYYLYKALPPCIEYVILHELIHMLYSKHNEAFYNFLSIHMPDWKERKRMLDYEVVQGL